MGKTTMQTGLSSLLSHRGTSISKANSSDAEECNIDRNPIKASQLRPYHKAEDRSETTHGAQQKGEEIHTLRLTLSTSTIPADTNGSHRQGLAG